MWRRKNGDGGGGSRWDPTVGGDMNLLSVTLEEVLRAVGGSNKKSSVKKNFLILREDLSGLGHFGDFKFPHHFGDLDRG